MLLYFYIFTFIFSLLYFHFYIFTFIFLTFIFSLLYFYFYIFTFIFSLLYFHFYIFTFIFSLLYFYFYIFTFIFSLLYFNFYILTFTVLGTIYFDRRKIFRPCVYKDGYTPESWIRFYCDTQWNSGHVSSRRYRVFRLQVRHQ